MKKNITCSLFLGLITAISIAQTTIYQPPSLLAPGSITPKTNGQQTKPADANMGSLLDGTQQQPPVSNTKAGINVNTNTYKLPPLTNGGNITKTVILNENTKPLAPLTYNNSNTVAPVQNTATQNLPPLPVTANSKLQGVKAVGMDNPMPPLSPIGGYNSNKVYNNNNNSVQNNGSYKMPELNTIQQNPATSSDRFVMPPLSNLDGNYPNAYSQNTNRSQAAMPELAPIVDGSNSDQNFTGETMPKLAPIKGENGGAAIIENKDGSYLIKSITLPHGTELKGTGRQAILVRPNIVVQPVKNTYKAGVGGGSGIDMADEEYDQVVYYQQPVQQPQYATKKVVVYNQPQTVTQKVIYQQQPAANYQTTTTTTTTTIPCNSKPVARKWKPKPKAKVVYQPVYVYQQPQQVVYEQPKVVYEQPKPVQKVQERLIYVPFNQQQNQQQPQQVIIQKPIDPPSQKIVYTDYTKIYYQEPQVQANSCSCPVSNVGQYYDPKTNQYVNPNTTQYYTNNNQYYTQTPNQYYNNNPNYRYNNQYVYPVGQGSIGSVPGANNPQKYYAPANYQGLNAGPTSGDYAATASTSNEPFKYTFFVNRRGKYSVKVYNQYAYYILGQNGQLTDYSPKTDANGNNIRLNYFGKPESVAGTSITYNYNRTVNKIGNIKFEYDFESFFKSVNGSNVFYNNRSSLDRVDNVRVIYDGAGYVTGVDNNDGLIQVVE